MNLETEPSDFDFEIALGGSHGDRSDAVFVHPVGEARRGHVWIQQPQSGSTWRQLEVHSPLTGRDGDGDRKEYELTEQCAERLALALTLYCRVRLPSDRAHLPVTLRGNDLSRFRAFASRLLPFQADRIRLSHARQSVRYGHSDADLLQYFGVETRSGQQSALARSAHIVFAAGLFERVIQDRQVWLSLDAHEFSLVLLSAAAEALFTSDHHEIANKLALRMGLLNGDQPDTQHGIFKLVKRCYGVRSQYVHGAIYDKKDKKLLTASAEEVRAFANLVRSSILYFIALSERNKTDLLSRLDDAVFFPSNLSELRREANRFWGRGDSDVERLQAADWMGEGAA